VLLLDYDGTLAPFRIERDQAVPYGGVRDAVGALLASGHTRVVVISGRTITDLRPLLGVEPPPELWGTHGWERLEPGAPLRSRELAPAARAGLERARAALAVDPARIEVKPASVAVHVRGLPAAEEARILVAAHDAWTPIAREGGLVLHPFDGGLELRARGWDKGDAVRAVLASEPEGVVAAYLGDDLTDEDAFRALDELGQGAAVRPLGVLVRGERRETRATVWLRPPDELLAFLERWNRSAR
jgi:trehalose 6-phosphate phosphatase